MKVTLAEPAYIKPVFDTMSSVLNEVVVDVNSDRIIFRGMDPSNAAYFELRLENSLFIEYDVDKDEIFSLNMGRLKNIFGVVGKGDMISWDKENGDFGFEITGLQKDRYTLSVLDNQKDPQLDINEEVTIESPSDLFENGIKKARVIHDDLEFNVEDMELTISSNDKMDHADIHFKPNDEVAIDQKEEGTIHSMYSGELLEKVTKVTKAFDKVRVSFSDNGPVQLKYNKPDKLVFRSIIAMRIAE